MNKKLYPSVLHILQPNRSPDSVRVNFLFLENEQVEEIDEEEQKMSDEEVSRNSPLGAAQVAAGLAPASVASSLSQSQNNNIYAKAQEALRAHYQHMGLMMTRFSDFFYFGICKENFYLFAVS